MAPYYKNPSLKLYATAWMGAGLECITLSKTELDAAKDVDHCLRRDFGNDDPMLLDKTTPSYPTGPDGSYHIYEILVPGEWCGKLKFPLTGGPLNMWRVESNTLWVWGDIYRLCLNAQNVIQIDCPRLHPKTTTELPLDWQAQFQDETQAQFKIRDGEVSSPNAVETKPDPVAAADASFMDFAATLKRGLKP